MNLVSYSGYLYILVQGDDPIYVEPLGVFLTRTPADKDRRLRIAWAWWRGSPSKLVH